MNKRIRNVQILHTVYEIPSLRPINNPDVTLDVRVEIFKAGKTYIPRVWFLEMYKLQPSFPSTRTGKPISELSDFELWTLQMSLLPKDLSATSARTLVRRVISVLERVFENIP
jgi:hypothetical protein